MTDNDQPQTTEPIPPMPPTIAAAVVQVMAGVKRLLRTEENKFQKYNYTSIDNFLEATGPLCAAAGLIILAEEEEIEITQAPKADREGTSNFLRVRWAFTLAHASGVLYGPLHRTVIVPASGAQAFGSAQSYALKQFARGLFQIPTGDDDDPDSQEKRNLPANQTTKPPARKPAPRLAPGTVQVDVMLKTIRACESLKSLCETLDALPSIFGDTIPDELKAAGREQCEALALLTATKGKDLDKLGAFVGKTRYLTDEQRDRVLAEIDHHKQCAGRDRPTQTNSRIGL
jgi:hypothetical protein